MLSVRGGMNHETRIRGNAWEGTAYICIIIIFETGVL